MQREWLLVEHYRMHLMELWPDGPRKEAGLAAARSTLESLGQMIPKGLSFACATCAMSQTVTVMPHLPRFTPTTPAWLRDLGMTSLPRRRCFAFVC